MGASIASDKYLALWLAALAVLWLAAAYIFRDSLGLVVFLVLASQLLCSWSVLRCLAAMARCSRAYGQHSKMRSGGCDDLCSGYIIAHAA